MEASTGVLHRLPFSGAGVGKDPFDHSSRFSCSSLKVGMGVKLENRKLIMGCGFCDEGYLEYYSSGRVVRCGGKGKKEKDIGAAKTMKKKMKLLKGLSKNLSDLRVGFDVGLVDQVQGKTISEAADLLLGQLQQLKAEEKALKRKRKEEKALMKMKAASELQGTGNCEMSSSSSSSESSESSDDECQNLVDMKSMKIGTLAQTIPEACDRALENATLNPTLPIVVEPQPLNSEADTSVVGISTTSSTGRTTSLEVPVPEQKSECCLGGATDCHIGNASVAAATTTTAVETKRIEVCMGGKCKRLGAGAILDKLQCVVGIEAAVSGCRCMGKCKVGPNVRLSGCSSSNSDTFQASDSVAVSSAPTSSSLCIGVGLEDVNMIAANLLGGRCQEVRLANAVA